MLALFKLTTASDGGDVGEDEDTLSVLVTAHTEACKGGMYLMPLSENTYWSKC